MWYSTHFDWKLTFVGDITVKQLAKLKTYLGEDMRNHPEWENDFGGTYINYSLLEDFSGIEWSGSEKSYDMVEKLNFVLGEMRKEYPDFLLEWQLNAQWEDIYDRWILAIEDWIAVEKKVVITGTKIECPHCYESFFLEDTKN